MDLNLLNTHEIKSLEIDLIDACNLKCPLCNRNSFSSKDKYLPLGSWKEILKQYPSIHTVYFLGTRSEHTLYPDFLDLYKYIKSLGVKIVLSTNSCTNTPEWWRKLRNISSEEDIIRFAIDGTTQEIYEKYRVGGDLERVLLNHSQFKGKGNDWVQYILFEHNKDEQIDELASVFEGRLRTIHSSFSEGVISPRKSIRDKYKSLNTLIANKKAFNITCHSKEMGEVFINYKGEVSPCCHYNENRVLAGNPWDFKYDFEYDFCRIVCDNMCTKLRKEWDIEI